MLGKFNVLYWTNEFVSFEQFYLHKRQVVQNVGGDVLFGVWWLESIILDSSDLLVKICATWKPICW